MSGYSFKTFDASGTAQAFLPDFSSFDVSFELSDVGALTLNYPKVGVNYSALGLIRVEVGCFLDGVEMDDGRFTLQSYPDDGTDPDKIVAFAGVSLLNRLGGALVYSADGSTTVATDQSFANVTAGTILRTLFQQNSTRGGVMSVLTWASFSNTTDSNGNAWASTLGAITYTVGVSYLDVVRNLVDNGIIEVKMVGRDLRVFNPNGCGQDRTAQAEPVVLRRGRDFLEAPDTNTNEQIASVALIQGDEGLLLENVNSSMVSAWGRIETFISQGGINDSTTLGVLAAQEILRRSAIRSEKTRKISLYAGGPKPYTDYRVADYIYSDSGNGNGMERLRVRQLVVSGDASGIQTASLVLNDKFLEQEVAIARKVNGILGGASATGSVAIPTEPGEEPPPDTTIPSQVTGLSWTSAAYQNAYGDTLAQLTISWTAVSTNTDSTAIDDLAYYEVQIKPTSGSLWGQLGSFTTSSIPAYCTVPSNYNVDVRVRAVDTNGNKGAYSSTASGATAADATAPPVPSTPTVTPYLGQLRIGWDGLGVSSAAMPTDFKQTEVHLSTSSGFTPSSTTLVDILSGAGYSVQTKLTYGTTYYVKLISVDRSGNKSAASTQASAVPATVTGLDIAALTIATSNMADLAISTAKIADAAILNAKIANLAVDDAKIGNMSVGKLTAGILAADVTVSARIKTADTGARVELNSAGLQGYNSSSVQTINVASATGAVTITGAFKTGVTGPRVEMTNSTDRSTVEFYGSAAVDAAFINSPVDGSGAPTLAMNSGPFTMLGVPTKHRIWLDNASGIFLQSYVIADQSAIGYGLFLHDTSYELSRTSSVGNVTGGAIYGDTTTFRVRRYGGNVLNGGQIYADQDSLWLEAQASGTPKSQIILVDDSSIKVHGRFDSDNANGGNSALFVGLWNVTPNPSASVGYGVTMETRPNVMWSIEKTDTTVRTGMISAFDATGFTYLQSASVIVNFMYWCYRIT